MLTKPRRQRSERERGELKELAAARALEFVRPHMVLGLGTGSTVVHFIDGLGRLVASGLPILCVPSSKATEAHAKRLGIPLTHDPAIEIQLAVDGTDEVDPELRLIKGRGGALTREKLVAAAAQSFLVIADDSKEVDQLGEGVLPVEVMPLLWKHTARRLEGLGATWTVRDTLSGYVETDNGNFILDLLFPDGISEPEVLDIQLNETLGVVGHGLFIDLAAGCIIAGPGGVREIGTLPQR